MTGTGGSGTFSLSRRSGSGSGLPLRSVMTGASSSRTASADQIAFCAGAARPSVGNAVAERLDELPLGRELCASVLRQAARGQAACTSSGSF